MFQQGIKYAIDLQNKAVNISDEQTYLNPI